MNKNLLKFSLSALLEIFILILFNYSASAAEINDQYLNPNLSQKQNSVEFYQSFIIGQWRGYYQEKNFTMYYGYDFRPDGTYLARHRVYQKETTILDEFWEGKWQFTDTILTLKGIKKNGKGEQIFSRFQVTEDYQLSYLDGSLSPPYIPIKMGKMN